MGISPRRYTEIGIFNLRLYGMEREALAKTLNDTSGLVQNVGVMIAFLLGRAVQPFSSKTCFESNYGFRA